MILPTLVSSGTLASLLHTALPTGAVPYHWGHFRGVVQDISVGDLEERVLNNELNLPVDYSQA